MKKRNNAGATLVEVILVFSILSLVSALSFLVFNIGNKVYDKTLSQYTVQTDARSALDLISTRIRGAVNVSIISVETAKAEIAAASSYNYMYIDDEYLHNVIYNGVTHTETVYGGGLIASAETFTQSDDYTIKVHLRSSHSDKTLDLSLEIMLANMKLRHSPIDGSGGHALRYRLPED